MNVFVAGASGATGRLLVQQLLSAGHFVRVIVRHGSSVPSGPEAQARLTVIRGSLLDFDDDTLARYVAGCDAVASCLGHNLTIRGIFGPPRHLVTDAVRRLCGAMRRSRSARKFVLMNTTAVSNRDISEPQAWGERVVLSLLRVLVPPQRDNEDAAEYLRTVVGRDDSRIEWVSVRPDTLIDEETVSPCDVHPSPVRSPIFDAGKTSRINVAHFMAQLITDDEMWAKWRGAMPVVYNRDAED